MKLEWKEVAYFYLPSFSSLLFFTLERFDLETDGCTMGTFVAGVAAEAAAYAGGLRYMMLQGGRDAAAVG